MNEHLALLRAWRMAAVVACAIAVTACASTPDGVVGGVAGAGATAGNAVPGSAQDFTVNVGDRIYFDADSTDLRGDAKTTLDRQAQWLMTYPRVRILVEGHADERGTREYNIALGSRRATGTKAYLESKGISASRIRVISYGKERPVAVCNDDSCWNQNRRAVTVIEGGAGT